jgi:signal transduction histidine kinase
MLSIMGSLILLFIITLSLILLASYREIRQNNTEMLERYADLYYPGRQPEEREEPEPGTGKPPINDRPDYRLSTFYSVAVSNDGTVLESDNGEKDLYSEEELVGIAMKLLAGNQTSGKYENLSYIIKNKGGYTLVAFLDNTLAESSMNTLLHNFLIIGGAAIIVLFFISMYMSKQIIHPLEENDRQQKQFISDAGHELKTPVAVIDANAELLSREIGENEWLINIRYENERMGGLVKQLLDLSRAECAEVPMEIIDLSRIVTGETLAFESLAFDQGKTIQNDIEAGIHIIGNEAQLSQLTSILLDNAVRHSAGNVIEISLKSQAHMAVIAVTNEGDEIPPEIKEHLFDRFYRIDEARNSEGLHYGLGLSIAKAVATGHRGNISVSCHDGKIRFEASFPIKK